MLSEDQMYRWLGLARRVGIKSSLHEQNIVGFVGVIQWTSLFFLRLLFS